MGGKWSYQTVVDTPGSLYVNGTKGHRNLLRRFEPSHAEVALGVALAPNGNTLQQAIIMRTGVIKWADAMRTGSTSKNDEWLVSHSTIWHTLVYPPPAIILTREQYDQIMASSLQHTVGKFLPLAAFFG